MEGRGPIYIDMAEFAKPSEGGAGIFQWDRPHFKALFGREFDQSAAVWTAAGRKDRSLSRVYR